jgi:hypothetical protein
MRWPRSWSSVRKTRGIYPGMNSRQCTACDIIPTRRHTVVLGSGLGELCDRCFEEYNATRTETVSTTRPYYLE